jgi:Tfp pilus assembly protein PilO
MDLFNFINGLKKNKQKLILAVIIAVAFVLFDIAFVMKAQVRSMGALGQRISKLKKDIEVVRKDLSLMRKNEKEKDTRQTSKVYTEGEISFLLQDIASLANENQIDVMQITQSKDTKQQEKAQNVKGGAKSKSKPQAEQKAQGFVSVAIKLDLTCTYHDLGIFLNQLEKGQQPLFAEDLRITRDPENYLREKAYLTLRTYVRK